MGGTTNRGHGLVRTAMAVLLGSTCIVAISAYDAAPAAAQQPPATDTKQRPIRKIEKGAAPPVVKGKSGQAPGQAPGRAGSQTTAPATATPRVERKRPERTPRAATPATPPAVKDKLAPRTAAPTTTTPLKGTPSDKTGRPVGKAAPQFKTRPVATPKSPPATGASTTAPVSNQPTTLAPAGRTARPDRPGRRDTKGPGGAPAPGNTVRAIAPQGGPRRLDDIKKGRVERVEAGGRRVIQEPGNRFIIRQDGRAVIRRDEGQSFLRFAPNARVKTIGNGVRETVIVRPGGIRVVTQVDANGRLLRRFRREANGREVVIIDNRRFYRNAAIGVGVAALGIGTALVLSRPAVALPREKYIVDYARASDEDIYETLVAPPVVRLERGYSLEEIRYSEPLRAHMRRLDLDTINFEFGSFEVTPDQYPKLERLARILNRVLQRNASEVFMIEGHTDAVGATEDNLTLSDRRAEAVVDILVSQFGIPPENLVTQGYGEQHLKVPSTGPERINRRVAVLRITPLLGQAQQ